VNRPTVIRTALMLLLTFSLNAQPAEKQKFQKVKFFPEPPVTPESDLQPSFPEIEGKELIRDSTGKVIHIKQFYSPPPPNLPTNQNQVTGSDIFVQDGSETSLALNYDNGNNLLAVCNTGTFPWLPHSNSTNGNLSWTARSFPNGAGTYTGYPFDPVAAPGNAAGEFFTTLIRWESNTYDSSHCIVSRSTDGGATFSLFFEETKTPVEDKEWIDVDRSTARGGGAGSAHDGKVYLSYDLYGPGFFPYLGTFLQVISAAGVADTEIQISGTFTEPVAGVTDGTFYVKGSAGIGCCGGTNILSFHEFTNGGHGPNTFSKSSFGYYRAGQPLGDMGRMGVNGHRIDEVGFMDIDRTNGPRRGYLYYISNRNPNPSNPNLDQGDVYISVSTNGAGSWSSAIIPTATGKTQYTPMIDVDEQGWLHVAYYQNETGAINGGVLNASVANLYYTYSTDGGASWSLPVKANDPAHALDYPDPPPDRGAGAYLIGDYASIQATGTDSSTKAYALWTGYDQDGSSGHFRPVWCSTVNTLQSQSPCLNDTEPPTAVCPDVVVNVASGQCDRVVNFSPNVQDNCPGTITVCNPPSGTTFPIGVDTVVCIATDLAGNADTCSFTLTVRDLVLPSLTCPLPIVKNPDSGQCSAVVNYTVTASDNCPGVTLVCDPTSGTAFPVGKDTVICTATDSSGNIHNCSFTVTVRGTRGDLNGDLTLTAADVVLELNCVFLGTGDCGLCFADANCDGILTSADVVLELNGVFLGASLACP